MATMISNNDYDTNNGLVTGQDQTQATLPTLSKFTSYRIYTEFNKMTVSTKLRFVNKGLITKVATSTRQRVPKEHAGNVLQLLASQAHR